MLNPLHIKKDFPIFSNQPDLVYLDSTATSLKPQQVIDAENEYYTTYSANIFRGIYKLSEKATQKYEDSRIKVAQFIGARDANEIVFVRNATEGINLVASSWGNSAIDRNSEIVATIMEHHANFVPWQVLCQEKEAMFRIAYLRDDYKLDEDQLINLVTKQTKLVAIAHVSNVLGVINPIKSLVTRIKQKNPDCLVLIDGVQAAAHMPIDVVDLGCDFYVFSAHKMLGPTGVGVLWGKYKLLSNMKPYQYGGDMISAVYEDHSEFKVPPHRFEAGTPHIAGVISFGTAIEYLQSVGMNTVRAHEKELCSYFLEKIKESKLFSVIGPKNIANRCGVMSMFSSTIHAHDVAQMLDSNNICVRSGHHCAMPLHLYLRKNATVRASFYLYTSKLDIDKLISALRLVEKKFA